MYLLKTESQIDAAHFLYQYKGKCSNIHGHRWRIVISVSGEELAENIQDRGMVVDFGKLKDDLKEETERFDHMFIVEKGSLKEKTVEALEEEGFLIRWVDFRPMAENFAKYFYEIMTKKGYCVTESVVYETPNNCAVYQEQEQ